MASLEEIRNTRLHKLDLLKKAGVDPYPAKSWRTHTIKQALDGFDDFVAKIERYVSVLGIGAKKKMICNYMTENNLIRVNYTDLGLTCFKRFVGSCKCV